MYHSEVSPTLACFTCVLFRSVPVLVHCVPWRFQMQDYEPTGTTPVRCEPEVATKGTIESLRAMPIDALIEEFRENNSYDDESFDEVNEPKQVPSLIPRSPLTLLNRT